jgi:hypothetical protein
MPHGAERRSASTKLEGYPLRPDPNTIGFFTLELGIVAAVGLRCNSKQESRLQVILSKIGLPALWHVSIENQPVERRRGKQDGKLLSDQISDI